MARHEVDLDDAHESDLSYRVGLAWRELRRGAAMASLREHLFATAHGPLEPGQVDTLELIVQQPEWRMCDLAEALRVDPSTATRAVQRMVTMGLAERKPNRGDGRVVMVAATETGSSCHAELVRNRRALMQHVMGSFAAEERIIFADLLERFVDAVDTFVAELDPNPSG